jgi:hypothetical protein
VTFRGVTPRRFWDAETAIEVAVEKVIYRLEVDLEPGPSLIEQVACFTGENGQIMDLRLVCRGSVRSTDHGRDQR